MFVVVVACIGGFFAWRLCCKQDRPNVIVFLLDTLRADHLGVYGYERETTPSLDQFAKENIMFKYAVTAAPWTPPSVASLLTGMYVSSHGLMPPSSRDEASKAEVKLSAKAITLQQILKKDGYSTAAVSSNPWISKDFGFDVGFGSFVYIPRSPAEKVNAAAFKVLDELKENGTPFFLYLHYLDPHDPYTPPESHQKLFVEPIKIRNYSDEMQGQIRLYDQEIRYMDDSLGKMIQHLKDIGVYDNSIIVILGDHGEQFEEHGYTRHGNQVFNTETHVPLLMHLPHDSEAGKVIDHTVSVIDIFPTILGLLHIETPTAAKLGISLLDEESQSKRAGVMSEISHKMNQRSFVNYEGKKLIVGGNKEGDFLPYEDPSVNIVGVYDSIADHFENVPLKDGEVLEELQDGYRKICQKALELKLETSQSEHKVSDDTLNQLESLGYLK